MTLSRRGNSLSVTTEPGLRRTGLDRGILVGLIACVLAAMYLLSYVRTWEALPLRLQADNDFAPTYAAAQMWRNGDGAQIYDAGALLAYERRNGANTDRDTPYPYLNPPVGALLAAPVTVLTPAVAYRTWSMLQVLLVFAAVAVAARAAPWPKGTSAMVRLAAAAIAAAGAGTGEMLLEGQWDGVPTLALALAYRSWRRGDHGRASLLLAVGFGASKPHLSLALAAFTLCLGRRRAVMGALTGVAAVAVASIAAVGPGGAERFLTAPSLGVGAVSNHLMLGFVGLFSPLGTGPALWVPAGIAGGAATGVACWLGWSTRSHPERLEPALAGATALSLLVAPHLLVHDLVLLAPALTWMTAWALNAGALRPHATGRPGTATHLVGLGALWIALTEVAFIDNGNQSSGPPGRLVPWVLLAIASAAAWAGRAPERRRVRAAPA